MWNNTNNLNNNFSKEDTTMFVDECVIDTKEYYGEFWDKAMKGKNGNYEKMKAGKASNGMFVLPYDSNRRYHAALTEESFFRKVATCVNVAKSQNVIWGLDSEDVAECVAEGGSINVSDMSDDFTKFKSEAHKIAGIVTLPNDFVTDRAFELDKYLPKRFAKCFNRAEENVFLNGDGADKPVGVLHDTEGAETGVTTVEITFDDVINLYMSVKPKYRKNGVWVMNDETALILRKLKDADGNYIWSHNTDTILGKPVHILEHMPGATSGSKPIAFGDFSYYWIINRRPLAVRTLAEKFALNDQTGYLAVEYLDGRLIHREAIKALQIS